MIERQLELERKMVDNGIERYRKNTDKAENAGRGSTTTYSQRLLPTMCIDLADAIEGAKEQKGPGRKAKYLGLLKGIDSNQAAFITLKVVFDHLIKGGTVTNLAMQIGQRIEDQVRFTLFADDYSEYYAEIVSDFKKKKTVEYRHMRNVLRHVAKTRDNWVDWTPRERLLLGVKLIELTILATALIKKVVNVEKGKHKVIRIEATDDAMEWIQEHMQEAELLHPEFAPCIMPPCDWVGLNDGGFFSPELRRRVPFVKIKSRAHREALQGADFSEPMKVINKLQKTAWRVNAAVHDVIKEVWRMSLGIGLPASEPYEIPVCPVPKGVKKEDMDSMQEAMFSAWKRMASRVYTAERERVSKSIQLSRILSMAGAYRSEEEFYYVYNCDFRGRIYTASPGLTPQGADYSKGLLEFARGHALGDTGFDWLCVHGANTYGYDKDSFAGRRRWVRDNDTAIRAVAANPLGSAERAFWADADKPYQFLAFCFEYIGAVEDKHGFVSHLPIAMDGSCNGIQNFSAMLLDGVGGKSTNLLPSDVPNDIYQDVAEVCIRRIQREDTQLAKEWLQFGVTRKLTKKPVMTLPYGSTKQSCFNSVVDYIMDNKATAPWEGADMMRAAKYMSDTIWESIGQVVIAARGAMAWLQKASYVMSRANIPMTWHTPLGFRVYQGTMKRSAYTVTTQLMGRCELNLTEETDEVDKYRQANGISPNFVHSYDACHLGMTVLQAEGINDWQMVHDSYGCHACFVPEMRGCIQGAFVDMYTSTDVLKDFKYEMTQLGGKLPELPEYGDLDMNEVVKADYFFA